MRFHPNLAEVYRERVENLRQSLNETATRAEAAEILRSLIREIRLVPIDGKLHIYLAGELANLLNLATKKNPGLKETGVQTTLVAGTGFEPVTFRL